MIKYVLLYTYGFAAANQYEPCWLRVAC